jgi:hypothetical protein
MAELTALFANPWVDIGLMFSGLIFVGWLFRGV